MQVIAGLGNPEKKYDGTRHNTGFAVMDAIAEEYGIGWDRSRWKGLVGKGVINGEKVILVKPLTYMNLSGDCIQPLMAYYKLQPSDLIVIYDDIDLAPGKIRVRPRGSAGGHNGMKSIIARLGSQEFRRVRVGVGAKPAGWDLADWVLSHFSSEDEAKMKEGRERAEKAAVALLGTDVESVMNRCNA
ncbi:MAG: aminoacyl-tRNA hydrolase [Lachnospiraceae bacterium]|jgi:PTH1 family peptidyl-tRNA hydrolase|nr:aminoacyl-tRNA hydrolase [Lachnospiraceae bacterium]MCH4032140.1 aminoacyl-tRNA hydrolase [Lachnospiraceae bacterium]MCH4108982.1 aminoacyl-tRNA hydrolase [Lachnospiraceae bacterium]MCI1302263.1 aminoacyl-tRNA hydrolase [Lachnospiraceae bacterium]MCI1332482.1 aminoacyl-tRNA hydrolase [Lachnospiraceae bacterium]